MNSNFLVSKIEEAILDDGIEYYIDVLQNFDRDAISDGYWRSFCEFYDRQSEEDKSLIHEILRQVSIDVLSNIFGILDGSDSVCADIGDLVLLDSRNQRQNGDLQEVFLGRHQS